MFTICFYGHGTLQGNEDPGILTSEEAIATGRSLSSPKQAIAASSCLKQSLTSQERGASKIWREANGRGAEKQPNKQAWFKSPSVSQNNHRISANHISQ